MLDDDFDYDKECERVRKENVALLGAFRAWLTASGKSKATINKHCLNIDFFINHFLLYNDVYTAEEGIAEVSSFMGDWFIRKASWSSETSLKSNATSLRQFYAFMLETERITQADFDTLKSTIKEELPEWLETVKRYWDPDVDHDDIF